LRITIIPKFQSTFLDPTIIDVEEDQDLINYELPKELIGRIRTNSATLTKKEAEAEATSSQPVNAYLVLKKEN
jgi:hypothetical protein